MRLIEKLIVKRDAAHAEYVKWQTLIDTLQTDPDFASITHHGATKAMAGMLKLKTAHEALNGNGNGHVTSSEARAAAARASWTPERRAKYSRRMKKAAKEGRLPQQIAQQKKARKTVTISAEERARRSERMRARRADPASEAKRLKALRKKLKEKKQDAAANA